MLDKLVEIIKSLWLYLMRALIFLGCFLVFINQIVKLIEVIRFNSAVPGTQIGGHVYFESFIIFLTAITGFYAAFRGRPPIMQSFQALLVICILLHISLVITSPSREQILRDSTKTIIIMRESMIKYNWKEDAKYNATSAWNELQRSAFCCGLEEPSDWDISRPSKISKDLFPGTCCVAGEQWLTEEGLCPETYRQDMGCVAGLVNLNYSLVTRIYASIFFLASILLVSLLTCSCCTPKLKEKVHGIHKISFSDA